MADRAIIAAVRKYLRALSQAGIHASRAVLFGSFARGDAKETSDIDVVVIAPEFDGRRSRRLVERLWVTRDKADNRIEPIPCGEKEWETEEERRRDAIPLAEGTAKEVRELGEALGVEVGF